MFASPKLDFSTEGTKGSVIGPKRNEFREKTGRAPTCLAFGFAALLLFMRGDLQAERRARGLPVPRDDKGERIAAAWRDCDASNPESLRSLVNVICADRSLWRVDLGSVAGFPGLVTDHLEAMIRLGPRVALEQHMASLLIPGSAPR